MFYVFHGPDELARSEMLADLKAKMGEGAQADLNTTYLDGQTVTMGQIQEACGALPFLSERRLVIVTGYLKRLWTGGDDGKAPADKVALQALADYLPDLPETARLVFLEDDVLPGKHPILVLAEKLKEGYSHTFGVPTKDEDLAEWIDKRVTHKGASIQRAAALALGVSVGHDTRVLDSEIDKLITYVGGDHPSITTNHVELLVPYTGEAKIWTMVDAIGLRDARTALQHLHGLLDTDPVENHPLRLLAMIVRQFRILIQVKEATAQGLAMSTIARQVGIRDFAAEKARRQAMNFSMAQLEAIYARLLTTDLAIKTGKMEEVLALDTLVAALCGPQAR
jgi:DNA polymerase III subunit delta